MNSSNEQQKARDLVSISLLSASSVFSPCMLFPILHIYLPLVEVNQAYLQHTNTHPIPLCLPPHFYHSRHFPFLQHPRRNPFVTHHGPQWTTTTTSTLLLHLSGSTTKTRSKRPNHIRTYQQTTTAMTLTSTTTSTIRLMVMTSPIVLPLSRRKKILSQTVKDTK